MPHSKSAKASQSIMVQDAQSSAVINTIKPLVCTDEINTAIMQLDYLAYTNEESSERAYLFIRN